MWDECSCAVVWAFLPTACLLAPPINKASGAICGSAGKESPFNAGDLGSIPGLGWSPGEGKGYPLQYSGLENSKGVAKSWTWLSDFHFTSLIVKHLASLQLVGVYLMPRLWIHISPPFTSILGEDFFFFREPFILFTFPAFLCSCSVIYHVQLLVIPWNTARQASLSITNSWSLLKLMSIESVMSSNHLILCHRLLLLPPIPPSIRVFPMSWLFTSDAQSIGASASA